MQTKTTAKLNYQPPAVQRAFQLLQIIADSPEGLGITELARKLDLSKSTVHGLTKGLQQAGALYQNPVKKKYFLGSTILDLAFRNWNYIQLCQEVQPFLDQLRDRIGETVFWGALSQNAAVIMAKAESNNPLKISAPPGSSIPLLAGAVGKVLLAQMTAPDILRIIKKEGLPRFTPNSIVDDNRYLLELDLVRQQGYALDDEEYLPGIRALAVALGNRRGLPLAIWVVGFAGSMKKEKMEKIIAETLAVVSRLRSMLDKGLS